MRFTQTLLSISKMTVIDVIECMNACDQIVFRVKCNVNQTKRVLIDAHAKARCNFWKRKNEKIRRFIEVSSIFVRLQTETSHTSHHQWWNLAGCLHLQNQT